MVNKTQGSIENWEERNLGADENFVGIDEDFNISFDDAHDLQLISIRLSKSLIENYKFLANLNGLGYQPLMREVLKRWADCENKKLARDLAEESSSKDKNEDAPPDGIEENRKFAT